jgi:hypothetical protein
MQAMKASLERLTGDLLRYQGGAFTQQEKARVLRITRESSQLAGKAHAMAESKALDPALKILAMNLDRDLEHGAAMWKQGHHAYGRTVLLQSTALCMACHTRKAAPELSASEEPVRGADLSIQATYFSAVRDFDKALGVIRLGIADDTYRLTRSTEWERFIRQGLQIAVRSKQSPDEGLKLLEQVLATRELPVLFRKDVESWMAQLKKWEQESARVALTEEGAWAEALRLHDQMESKRKFPADRSAEIEALRLSSILHGFLERYPATSRLADALYLQGVAYEALRPAALWNVSESFWAACIRTSPHTGIARQCYQSLEDSVLLGWTGSAGVILPDAVRLRLKGFSELAGPAKVEGPEPSVKKP